MTKLLVFLLAAMAAIGEVRAQPYPSRPITLVVPFVAGGAADTIARAIAEPMRAALGQPIIIENIGGAGGSIGVGRAARGNPDGHTLVIGNWGTHVINGVVYSLQYDLQKDFEPISLLASEFNVIAARKTMPANNLVELIAWLKANPDKATVGTSGVGGNSHAAGAMFLNQTGTRFQLVPYRGANPAMQDMVAGHIDLMITGSGSSAPLIREGFIKGYAVTAAQRLAAVPDVPTVDEAGLRGFYISVWHGLWAPRGTPADVVAALSREVRRALAEPAVQQRLAAGGQIVVPPDQQTPDALGKFHQAEIEKWWPIIKAANIRAE